MLIGAPPIGFSPRNELIGKVRLSFCFVLFFLLSLLMFFSLFGYREIQKTYFENEKFYIHFLFESRAVHLKSRLRWLKKCMIFLIFFKSMCYYFVFFAFSSLPVWACPAVWSLRKNSRKLGKKEVGNRNSSCFIFL